MSGAGRSSAILDELEEITGPQNCLSDPEVTAGYRIDWTGRFSGEALCVVRPRSLPELSAVLAAVRRHGACIIPQGGNTGLVGGSVPRASPEVGGRPQILLSMQGFGAQPHCEPSAALLEAGSGTSLAAASAVAQRSGYHLGIDLASRQSATLGGMVGTNAGGIRVIAFGSMRERLRGVEAVLSDGTVVSQMGGLVKDNISFSLASLLCGSEGTLAIVTRVLMGLEPVRAHRVTVVAALRDLSSALHIANTSLRSVRGLEAVELTLRRGMELVCGRAKLAWPGGGGGSADAFLTIEAAGDVDPSAELVAALDDPAVLGTAVADSDSSRSRLWAYRELHTEAVSSLGVPHKLDVSVRLDRLEELIVTAPIAVGSVDPSAEVIMWGHVGDGNIHVNVVGPDPDDERVDDAVFSLVLSLGGSISAEHGIGMAKRRWMASARTAGTLELMRRVKSAVDPENVLNPGVLEPVG